MRINNVRKKRRFRELVILLLCMITAAGLMPMHARAETEQQTQSGGDRPKTPQPGTITNIGIAYIAFADIHSLLKEFF